MGEAGFEPAKAMPPDLQSGPFDRSGIPPPFFGQQSLLTILADLHAIGPTAASHFDDCFQTKSGELAVGLEPTTSGLQNRGSAD